MGKRSRFYLFQRLTDALELPKDVVLDLPKATVFGSVQAVLENHKGILEYTPESIRVRTSIGEIFITGQRLKIGSILPDELVIDGQIHSIVFHGNQGR